MINTVQAEIHHEQQRSEECIEGSKGGNTQQGVQGSFKTVQGIVLWEVERKIEGGGTECTVNTLLHCIIANDLARLS